MTNLKKRIYKLKGGCVHELTQASERCTKCDMLYRDWQCIPDYLDDPAATLGAVIELVLAGWLFGWRCGEFTWNDGIFHKVRIVNVAANTAIWTAWCELKESA